MLAVLPRATLSSVEAWFVREGARLPAPFPPASFDAVASLKPSRRAVGLDGIVETPVELADGRIFAMLCEPAGRSERSPLVVIANTAATHHVGDGRFNVELARSLAQAGIASLRLDADGIGDSRGAGTVANPSLLSYDQLAADTSLAVDWAVDRGIRASPSSGSVQVPIWGFMQPRKTRPSQPSCWSISRVSNFRSASECATPQRSARDQHAPISAPCCARKNGRRFYAARSACGRCCERCPAMPSTRS